MPNSGAPPALTADQKTALSSGSKTNIQSLEYDPYNLNSAGTGILSNAVIQGSNEFFGFPTSSPIPEELWPLGTGTATIQAPLTASDTIAAFAHLSSASLANIQSQMYRAGLYSGNYQPLYGQLHPEDIYAFRSLIIGLASNPSQGTLTDYLSQAARLGDTSGLSTTKRRDPLVVQLKDPNDIRAMIQSGANNVYGKFLSEDDVQKFISGYQAQDAAAQTAAYASAGFDPSTGAQTTTTPHGSTVTGPPTTAAGANLALSQQMYADHPVTAEMAQFVNQFDALKSTLSQRLPGGGVG